jgi:hypothetical protein
LPSTLAAGTASRSRVDMRSERTAWGAGRALFGRAQPRDFLDIDAVLASGRYGHDRLLDLAANADAGFDQMMFAGALSALDEMVESDFAEYHTSAEQIAGMRERFASWRDELLARAQRR